jgi:predicted DNA-binding transcriptional regulator YafY
MSQVQQTARLYWIDAEIRANRYPNAAKVAANFEVTPRTAFADFRHLRDDLHAPVRTRRGQGWYYTDPTYMLPFLALSEPEAQSLRRSLRVAEEYLSETEAHVVGLLLERLAPQLGPDDAAESLSGAIHLAPLVAVEEALLQACRQAVRQRQRLWLRYWGAHKDQETERTVNPYRVHYFRGEPHLIAWSESDDDVRQFFLLRVREWRLVGEERAFVPRPDFDIDAYLRRALGAQHGEEPLDLRVRFSPYQKRWIRERRYHASQQNEEQADGSLIVTMRVSGRDEVRRWLQGFGAEVEVLEPDTLRAEMVAAVKKMLKIYGDA